MNPISGGGSAAALWERVAAPLRAAGAEVATAPTRSREHAIELATDAAGRGDVVVAVGGDGLVRDVAGGAVAGRAPMAIVPAGRGNDLAATLGVPTEAGALARMLLDAPARAIDVLDVNGVIAPGNVYVGVDSLATRIINANRWVPALLLYRLAGVLAILRWRATTFTVVIDGRRREVRAHSVVLANSGAYGHGLRIVPPAVLDDGLLDVMIVGEGPRRGIVTFMAEAKVGAHVHRREVELCTARTVTVDVDRPLPLCADGDEIATLPGTVRIRARALEIIAPG